MGAATSGFYTENTYVDVRMVLPAFFTLELDLQAYLAYECGMELREMVVLLNDF